MVGSTLSKCAAMSSSPSPHDGTAHDLSSKSDSSKPDGFGRFLKTHSQLDIFRLSSLRIVSSSFSRFVLGVLDTHPTQSCTVL